MKNNKRGIDETLKQYYLIRELNEVLVDEFVDKVYVGSYDKATKTRDVEIV